LARAAFGCRPDVIPAPVDVRSLAQAAAAVPSRRGRLVVAFLGRLVPRKGALELVDVLAALPAPVRDAIDVRMGGSGPLASALATKVRAAGLESMVTLTGFVPESDKAAFLASADIAVFPSVAADS